MRQTDLTKLTVANFRSIRQEIEVPLDGTFVLVHGLNGTGKTSLLSALELALTGGVASMRRSDPNYARHLVHHGASEARIGLGLAGPEGVRSHSTTISTDGAMSPGALDAPLANHFIERCYLAQATLSRLLEMYQNAQAGADAPLTRYVKEILRLDELDNLIEGLGAAGDLRNTRREVPELRDSETRVGALTEDQMRQATELARLAGDIASLKQDMRSDVDPFGATARSLTDKTGITDFIRTLERDLDVGALSAIEESSRELSSLSKRLAVRDAAATDAGTVEQLEREVAELSKRAARWRESTGDPLEHLLDEARGYLPDVPSAAGAGPEEAAGFALQRLSSEASRSRSLLENLRSMGRERDLRDRRVQLIDQKISEIDADLGSPNGAVEELAHALAGLAPYVQSNDCPVCGRDYTEVSPSSLAATLTARIDRLSATAARMRGLSASRASAAAERQAEIGRITEIDTMTQTAEDSAALEARIFDLDRLTGAIGTLSGAIPDGVAALHALADAQRCHAQLLARDREASEIREQVADIADRLGSAWDSAQEIPQEAVLRLSSLAAQEIDRISSRRASRARAIDGLQRLLSLVELAAAVQADLDATNADLADELVKQQLAESRRTVIRSLIRTANEVRNDTIREVFSTKLNRVWRDLFVRLAPAEPFVPAFEIPEGNRPLVSAPLTTAHRLGGPGGAPATMLSAGNLNTAALTLFLALHLSASPRLPWLILDDPVQSMDDVHITHFAAVLRTLARDHGRKIVVAVHDRALFDYLSLELAPSREGDRLVTAELSRTTGGTVLTPNVTEWEPEPLAVM